MARTLKAVLLDVDGTLVDSNDLHARAWVEALEQHGYPVPFARVRRLIGKGSDKLVPELTGLESEGDEAQALGKACKERFMSRYLPQVRPFAHTRQLRERFRADGYRLAVASSSGADQLEGLLAQAGVADLIERETNADDAEHSKPDPDIVEATLHKLSLPAHEAIMLGDTPYDVVAATRAGVLIVGVRSGGWSDRELAGAQAVYDDPADLLAHYQESPFARGGR
jgi:phosphoglycolate phosphatase-like HAD superfamily hydrolase